jgi:hypothetical protein
MSMIPITAVIPRARLCLSHSLLSHRAAPAGAKRPGGAAEWCD